MEDIPNWIRAVVPLLVLLSTIIFMMFKLHFVSKKEFKEFMERYEQKNKEFEGKIIKQGKDIIEMKTDVKHMAKSLHNIEEFVVNPRKRRKD